MSSKSTATAKLTVTTAMKSKVTKLRNGLSTTAIESLTTESVRHILQSLVDIFGESTWYKRIDACQVLDKHFPQTWWHALAARMLGGTGGIEHLPYEQDSLFYYPRAYTNVVYSIWYWGDDRDGEVLLPEGLDGLLAAAPIDAQYFSTELLRDAEVDLPLLTEALLKARGQYTDKLAVASAVIDSLNKVSHTARLLLSRMRNGDLRDHFTYGDLLIFCMVHMEHTTSHAMNYGLALFANRLYRTQGDGMCSCVDVDKLFNLAEEADLSDLKFTIELAAAALDQVLGCPRSKRKY